MKQRKNLKLKTNFSTQMDHIRGFCNVEIYELEDQRKEVILCDPMPEDGEKFYDSPTNFFEYHATEIKDHLLANVHPKKILWGVRHEYLNPKIYPMVEIRVEMEFKQGRYLEPNWKGEITNDSY